MTYLLNIDWRTVIGWTVMSLFILELLVIFIGTFFDQTE